MKEKSERTRREKERESIANTQASVMESDSEWDDLCDKERGERKEKGVRSNERREGGEKGRGGEGDEKRRTLQFLVGEGSHRSAKTIHKISQVSKSK